VAVTPVTIRRYKAAVVAEFNDILDEASRNNWSTPCKDRWEEFTEYKYRPTPAAARAMCAGCPLLGGICGEYAEVTKPDSVVLDGRAWTLGKPAPELVSWAA